MPEGGAGVQVLSAPTWAPHLTAVVSDQQTIVVTVDVRPPDQVLSGYIAPRKRTREQP